LGRRVLNKTIIRKIIWGISLQTEEGNKMNPNNIDAHFALGVIYQAK